MNPRTLREAWSIITADDYDSHMAAVGQAQANADIVHELFAAHAPAAGARVLFAGAGTGQIFDYLCVDVFRPFSITFTDINEGYLRKLSARLRSAALSFRVLVDDIEDSSLDARFALVIAILVLEHVDAARAIASMCRLAAEGVFVVVQENPASLCRALTREPVGTMAVFRQVVPHLVNVEEIEQRFTEHGFARDWTTARTVLDEKKMVGIGFYRRR